MDSHTTAEVSGVCVMVEFNGQYYSTIQIMGVIAVSGIIPKKQTL